MANTLGITGPKPSALKKTNPVDDIIGSASNIALNPVDDIMSGDKASKSQAQIQPSVPEMDYQQNPDGTMSYAPVPRVGGSPADKAELSSLRDMATQTTGAVLGVEAGTALGGMVAGPPGAVLGGVAGAAIGPSVAQWGQDLMDVYAGLKDEKQKKQFQDLVDMAKTNAAFVAGGTVVAKGASMLMAARAQKASQIAENAANVAKTIEDPNVIDGMNAIDVQRQQKAMGLSTSPDQAVGRFNPEIANMGQQAANQNPQAAAIQRNQYVQSIKDSVNGVLKKMWGPAFDEASATSSAVESNQLAKNKIIGRADALSQNIKDVQQVARDTLSERNDIFLKPQDVLDSIKAGVAKAYPQNVYGDLYTNGEINIGKFQAQLAKDGGKESGSLNSLINTYNSMAVEQKMAQQSEASSTWLGATPDYAQTPDKYKINFGRTTDLVDAVQQVYRKPGIPDDTSFALKNIARELRAKEGDMVKQGFGVDSPFASRYEAVHKEYSGAIDTLDELKSALTKPNSEIKGAATDAVAQIMHSASNDPTKLMAIKDSLGDDAFVHASKAYMDSLTDRAIQSTDPSGQVMRQTAKAVLEDIQAMPKESRALIMGSEANANKLEGIFKMIKVAEDSAVTPVRKTVNSKMTEEMGGDKLWAATINNISNLPHAAFEASKGVLGRLFATSNNPTYSEYMLTNLKTLAEQKRLQAAAYEGKAAASQQMSEAMDTASKAVPTVAPVIRAAKKERGQNVSDAFRSQP